MDVRTVSVDMGAFTGATTHPLIYLADKYGAITVLDVQVTGIGAGTSIGLIFTSLSDVGTPAVSGTIASFAGTVVYAEGVVFEATVSDADVQPGQWLGVDQASGTCPATTLLTVTYAVGL
jgi:hypothetical protein